LYNFRNKNIVASANSQAAIAAFLQENPNYTKDLLTNLLQFV
jgi:hypothetical protein